MNDPSVVLRTLYSRHRNFLLYAIIGASGALLDFIAFLVLYNVFHVNPLLATTLSTSLGIANNFFLNVRFNFKVQDKLHHRFVLFYATGIAGLLLSVLIIFLAHDRAGLNANLAKFISIPLVVLCQYFANSKLSMRKDLTIEPKAVGKLLRSHWISLVCIASAVFFLTSTTFYLRGFDEVDNLLGGKLITAGQLPYSGFFSHHMPGMYWLAALLYPFTHANTFYFRLSFNILLLAILLFNFWLLQKYVSRIAAWLFLLIIPMAHVVGYGQMALAESIVAYLFTTALILGLFMPKERLSNKRVLAGISVLLFAIPFFSLSYIFGALIIYGIITYRFLSQPNNRAPRPILYSALLLGTPYIVFLLELLITGALKPFLYSILTFNSTYYAPLVGQESGGILATLLGIIVTSLGQIATIARQFYNPHYTVQLFLVVGFIGFCILLWLRRRRVEAVACALLLLVVNPLINIFNPPGISGSLASHSQHSLVYMNTALLFGILEIAAIWQSDMSENSRKKLLPTRAATLVYLLVIPLALLSVTGKAISAVFIKKEPVSLYAYSKVQHLDSDAYLVNTLTGPSDYAWIGPANFDAQLYMHAKRASAYTFFMPWQDACDRCRQELLADFTTQAPKVIVWGNYMYKDKIYDYHDDIGTLLSEKYFQARDPRLVYYHFLKHDRDKVIEKLEQAGYEI